MEIKEVTLLNVTFNFFCGELRTLPFSFCYKYLIILCSDARGQIDTYICHIGHLFINVELTEEVLKTVIC